MPIKLFKFAGILVQTLDEEKICSLDIVDDSISVHSVHHFMYIDLFATYSEFSGGMNISVGRISLSFPLNLVVTNVDAASPHNDTLLSVRRLQVNVQLLPLLKKQVEVDGISLQGATVNSNDLIHGMKLNGTLGELFISSHGVALDPETAIVNKVLLKDTDLSLCLNDTAAADTAASDTTYWKIILQDIDLQNVSFALDMPDVCVTITGSRWLPTACPPDWTPPILH